MLRLMLLLAPKYRFTVDDYYRMADTGILAPDARVELLEGEIIEMFPIGPFHSGVGTRLQTIFTKAGGDRWIVRSQYPIHLDDGSEPQPDLALVKPRDDFYTGSHPQPQDVYLLVEVADSSVRFDREEKMPVYARAGIAEYWLVDLVERKVEVYRDPLPDSTYLTVTQMRHGDLISPAAFPEVEMTVNALLGSG